VLRTLRASRSRGSSLTFAETSLDHGQQLNTVFGMKRIDLKREANRMISSLPKNADWEDLMYRIYVRKKIDAGLRDSAAGRVYTSAQIRKALKLAS
jgi:hypothetical protein